MSARGAYRCVFSVLFDDPDYQRLSAHARLVLLTLRQCRDAGAAAIFRYYREILRAQTGLTADQLEAALIELEGPSTTVPWIYRDEAVVWVRNALRYDPTLRLANERHRTGIENALKCLPQSKVVASFCEYYEIAKPSEWSPKTIGKVLSDHSLPKPIPKPIPIPKTEADSETYGTANGSPSSGQSEQPKQAAAEVRL